VRLGSRTLLPTVPCPLPTIKEPPLEKYEKLLKKALSLPALPGVYLMKGKDGEVLYVGKAKILKNRVPSYFRGVEKHWYKTRRMVELTEDFDYIICDNESEALILECSLIKKHCPKYNILLKYNTGQNFIRYTSETFPRIYLAKDKIEKGTYLGPYSNVKIVNNTINQAAKMFRIATCGKPLDGKISKPCLNNHIGICLAPCAGKVSVDEYNKNFRFALDFIKHGKSAVIKILTEEMNGYAENMQFEKAAKLRDRIHYISRLFEKQKVVSSVEREQDIIALVEGEKYICFNIFIIRSGRLFDSIPFVFERGEEAERARSQFITSYYDECEIPPKILTDGEVEARKAVEDWFYTKAGKKINISIPKIGEQLALLEMCRNNAVEHLSKAEHRTLKDTASLTELAELIGNKTVPVYIEAYDISHTAGENNVGAMVVFKDGKPLKSAYRKFIIKEAKSGDDYASMCEMLSRRFDEYEAHRKSDNSFGIMPDLVLLDGGIGQVSAVQKILEQKNISIPLFGLVKDTKHKTRALVNKTGEIGIKATRNAYTLLTNIQNEVHRFAVSFHRQKNKKKTVRTELTEIKGIGEARAAALLKHFKSVKGIKEASQEQLMEVKGITAANAEEIRKYWG